MSSLLYLWVGSKEEECNYSLRYLTYEEVILWKKAQVLCILTIYIPLSLPPSFPVCLTPGMQLCVTKPVLLESECSMRQGHMGFLPTSSLPFSPSLGCTLLQPARQHT